MICKDHNEKIRLFCKTCNKALCSVCRDNDHRECTDVVTVQDMLPEVKGQLINRREEFDNISDTYKSEIAKYGDEINEFQRKSTSVKTDITTTIQAIVDHLRAKETELLEKLDVLTDRQTEDLRSKVTTKKTETQMYQQQSQFIQQALELEDEAQLFEMYLSSGTDIEGDVTVTNREDRADVADIRFIHDHDQLKEEIEKMDVRSVDYTLNLTATPVLHGVIDAKLDGDVKCGVRDVVVMESSGTKVTVFADNNNLLKSVYLKGKKPCSCTLKVPSDPWCITVISEGEIAVTLPRLQNIITVVVTPDLELLSTIQTIKGYYGISALDQSTLVVGSSNPSSVDLIDMQGTILKTFTSPPVVEFLDPRYIHVTGQGSILVSDDGLKSVICLTQSGDVVFTYTPTGDRTLTGPWGITSTRSGDVLVTDFWAHKVIHLSKTGEFMRDILDAQHGLRYPTGLCVNEDKLCVIVDGNCLHKYKFGIK